MKQVLRRGLSNIVVEELPDPLPSEGQAIVKPLYSLISSGTETASIHQAGVLRAVADNPSYLRKIWEVLRVNGPSGTFAEVQARMKAYAVLGYSGAGVVAAKHPSVADLELGQRVAYGGEGTGHGEALAVSRNLLARVPDTVSLEQACFTTLGSIALNAVRVASPGLGDRVLIMGLGLVGQILVQLARCHGARVIGVDLRPERAALAAKLGAERTLSGGGVREAVQTLTEGRGVDCVIIAAASKSPAVAQSAVDLVRDRGRIVVVGAVPLELPWLEMYLKETELRMSRAYGPGSYDPRYERQNQDYPFPYVRWTENRNMEEFLRLAGSGQVQIDPLITHRFALDEAAKAYELIMDPNSSSLAVTLSYPAAGENDPVSAYRPKHGVSIGRPAKREGNLRVALVGAGNIAKWAHLPALKKIPEVDLRAIQTSAPAKAREYAERFGAASAVTDLNGLWADPELDAVVITSRNPRHAGDALGALRAGKHVFVEKPMALSRSECGELAAEAARTGSVLFTGFNRRFAPSYLHLKAALKSRGGPAVLSCRVSSPGISGQYWMAAAENGGAILGEACHFTDLCYWLLESEPVSVAAHSLPVDSKEPAGENNLCSVFRFADGSIASITYTTVGAARGGERMEAFAQGIGAGAEDFRRFWSHGPRRASKSSWFQDKGYDEQMLAFVKAARGGAEPAISARDGARATHCCLQMLAAARSGCSEPVDVDAFLSQ